MNRIKLSVIAFMLTIVSIAQNVATNTFNSEIGHFSFAYPSYLESRQINNAPHMLLKLDSKKYSITISLWKNNSELTQTIWDDDVVSFYSKKDESLANSEIVNSCEKLNLIISNNLRIKCLRSVMLSSNSFQGKIIKGRHVTYRVLHDGNYLQFVFFVFDFNEYWNGFQFSEEIMKGLKLL